MIAVRLPGVHDGSVWVRAGNFLVAVHEEHLDPATTVVHEGPVEVHVSLTDACGVGCPACYIDAKPNGTTPPLSIIFERLDTIAKSGTRTVAFGGGEPLLRDDLSEIARYTRSLGLVAVVTTSGYGGDRDGKEGLIASLSGFDQVNLSHDGVDGGYEAVRGRDGSARVARITERLVARGVRCGWNVVLTRSNFSAIEATVAAAEGLGVTDVQLLRVKPAGRATDLVYRGLRLTAAQVDAVPSLLGTLVTRHRGAPSIRIDCALVPFLAPENASPEELKYLAEAMEKTGVFGCEAGRALAAMRTDGTTAGCSFEARSLAHTSSSARPSAFHTQLPAPCSTCNLHTICRGGCRIVGDRSGDPEGRDVECPRVRRALGFVALHGRK